MTDDFDVLILLGQAFDMSEEVEATIRPIVWPHILKGRPIVWWTCAEHGHAEDESIHDLSALPEWLREYPSFQHFHGNEEEVKALAQQLQENVQEDIALHTDPWGAQ